MDFSQADKQFATRRRLGAKYSRSRTDFAVWSPCAQEVTLRLYKDDTSPKPYEEQIMSRDIHGVWSCSAEGNLDGVYYTFGVSRQGSTVETPDIYGKAAGVNGRRSMVFSPQSVEIQGWAEDAPIRCEAPTAAVIYELHVRDFSMDSSADFLHRGKLLAFCEGGVRNSFGEPAGIDYIASLGVTHLHLLPVMDFASVDEQSSQPQFNWGYDPLHYNVTEGSYCTNPHDGHLRVRELRQLVKSLHDRGIGVILDVVYNHTCSAADSPFNRLFPDYWYRQDENGLSNGSGCGNELATERRMVSRFICDSLCSLARDYHLDGFRFDLMGLMDIKTLNRCAGELRKINPDIILYGEGWTGGSSPLPEQQRAMKHHARRTDNVAMFSDDLRDGIKGSVFEDKDCGYINGAASKQRRELIKSVLCGGVYHPDIGREQWQCWAEAPLSSVNYVESHDNLTFMDKLSCSMPKAEQAELLRVNRLGMALVLLAQGIPFMQAGQELLRSKPDGCGGFLHDSYKSPDSVNCIKWDDVTRHRDISDYCKGLIAIRRSRSEFRITSAEEIRRIRFQNLSGNAFAMYIGRIILAVNPNKRPAVLKLPEGCYGVLADGCKAQSSPFAKATRKVSVLPHSILLLDKTENL